MKKIPLMNLTSFQRRKSLFYSVIALLALVAIDLLTNSVITGFSLAGLLPAALALLFYPEKLLAFWGTLGAALAIFYWTIAAHHLFLALLLASLAAFLLTPVVLGLLRAADVSNDDAHTKEGA